ncbi:MAG: tRNA (adenosine(37)-N6)-threonylcarbamoyltransferase complex ATPase subunit type 1 TsaE [Candidatus Nealsonbacteria bacterium CG23_combo_of_CG06-09_8_20_14_all_36_12]|uniref:tRNA threonylcarbamoyladenosine biosynthesis protein TsaE n=1 Tax=Candidatus Nealsonbacteria bacterium CG23_combo_of_CG06-09_8_20_14_all_36_12 TaxID=1974718 RepID=A0A2G9Z248_9BACT|nr:MAG: tRNA (adenosine(37)-N6)-threonylcarbamoyltransferase complex ATPase subunit type 1 TsaE [Candidatus Nealsonbacteria bacterium CG23_combo_of_CG06-09_8_20_14_all_36_12]
MSTKFEILTKNPSQTKKFGRILAKELLKAPLKKKKTPRYNSGEALIIGLEGDLGGGKTTFLQGFAKGLGIKEKILSPTFVIMKRFKIRKNSCPNSCKFASFYHIDCYRIQKSKEILNLGFKEIISNPKNIVAIEWADRIKKIIPKKSIILKFKFINQTTREIKLSFPQGLGDHFHQSSLYNRFS